jgi:hypothetical protein
MIMKKSLLWTVALMVAAGLQAQVEIDRPVVLTGGEGERHITGLELPVTDTEAASKEYVDAAVSASGGGGGYHPKPLAISDKSSSTMTFSAAVQYCESLSEAGEDDWRLPNFDELLYFAGSTADEDYLWTKNKIEYDIATNQNFFSIRLNDGKWSKGGVRTRFLPRTVSYNSGSQSADASSGGWITAATVTPTVGDVLLLPNFAFQSGRPSGVWTTNQVRYTINFADGSSLLLGPYENNSSSITHYQFSARDMEEAWLFSPVANIVIEVNWLRSTSTSGTWTTSASVSMTSAYEIIFDHADGNGLYTRCVR